jgi:hypothetical protein
MAASTRAAMISAEECRLRMMQCAQTARAAKTKKQRDIIFSMARSWETLAEQADRLERQKAIDARKS